MPQILYSPRAINPAVSQSQGSSDAGKIPILDANGRLDKSFTPITSVLKHQNLGTLSENTTLDFSNGNYVRFTLSHSLKLTLTPLTTNLVERVILEISQDSNGGKEVTWETGIIWPEGNPPKLSMGPSIISILEFVWDGSSFILLQSAGSKTFEALTAQSKKIPLPVNPILGDYYLVPEWETNANQIAYWNGAWNYSLPLIGQAVWVVDEATYATWNGTRWTVPQFSLLGNFRLGVDSLPKASASTGYLFKVVGKGSFANSAENKEILRPLLFSGSALNPEFAFDESKTTYAKLEALHDSSISPEPVKVSAIWYGFRERMKQSPVNIKVRMENVLSETPQGTSILPGQVSEAQLEYSLDGAIWVPIAISPQGQDFSYLGTLPDILTDKIQVRVSAYAKAPDAGGITGASIHIQDLCLEHSPTFDLSEGDYLFSNGEFWDVLRSSDNQILAIDERVQSMKAIPFGVAGLDSNGKVPVEQLPPLGEVTSVNGQKGDVFVTPELLLNGVILSDGTF